MSWYVIAIIVIVALGVLATVIHIVRWINLLGNSASSLINQIKLAQVKEATVPKSLSAVEKFVMPQLLNDFPEFNVAAAIDRVKSDAALFYRSAIENKVLFSDNSTTALLENLILPKDVKGNIIIHKAALSAYNKLGHDRILTYQASAEYMDTSDTRNQKRLILKYIAASDDDFSQNIHTFTCPNCGAPVPTIGDKVCKYCGIALQTSTSLGWYLMDIREG
ncbi:MAG: zinc ribbon domain-containing protein [Clostridia bacterium]|nr:zinc ribbon domain-containing protein [Clostridia bacterium]MBR5718898.1 zinc ribbon domain-containing protein [Clostridia bacterium]